MALWEFEGKRPKIGEGTWVAPSADVIGDVVIGKNCYIGPGARIRGDYGKVRVGDGCSIQENVIIHARPDEKSSIGNRVTLGHGCIIHNATLEDYVVVGMGAVVSDYVVMKEWSVLGEAGLARQRQEFEPGAIGVGVSAKIIGNIHDSSKQAVKEELLRFKKKYVEMASRFLKEGAFIKIQT
ncbi:MAG: gamma carbonic anhydrase family protein [Candidatus Hodarchaeales archaeon]|jgi:carbonic anhydrase/acetyltransferase-like protein (isoleucine patch superfamily)